MEERTPWWEDLYDLMGKEILVKDSLGGKVPGKLVKCGYLFLWLRKDGGTEVRIPIHSVVWVGIIDVD